MVDYRLLKEINVPVKLKPRDGEPYIQEDGNMGLHMIILNTYDYHDYEICYNRLKESIESYNQKLRVIDDLNYMMYDPMSPMDTRFMKQEQERLFINTVHMVNMYLEDIHHYVLTMHDMIYGKCDDIPTGHTVGSKLHKYLTNKIKRLKACLKR